MIRRPPRSTLDRSSAASDVYKRQEYDLAGLGEIGIGYKFKDRFSINMSARFQHSFTSLIENEGERNFGTTFGLGLKYYL